MAGNNILYMGLGFLGTLIILQHFRILRPANAVNMANQNTQNQFLNYQQ